jgi:ATP-binding cassette subfamily C (CFTR/MRP) protein 1
MHLTYRFITMLRGSLVSLILEKTFRLQFGTEAASAAVTHMSTDIDSISQGLENLHDIWASVVELGVGAYMLSRYAGAATFLIIIPALGREKSRNSLDVSFPS